MLQRDIGTVQFDAGSTPSADPIDGTFFYDTDTLTAAVYNDGVWGSPHPHTGTRNVLDNGDFSVNQRGFTSSTGVGFGFDRWYQESSGGTVTFSNQSFTLGSEPATGYRATNYLRCTIDAMPVANGSYAFLRQALADVRYLAGNDVTVSFWAKSDASNPVIGVELYQNGGTFDVKQSNPAGLVYLTPDWKRYSVTVRLSSISGLFLADTSNYLGLHLWFAAGSSNASRASNCGISNGSFDIWGVQLEGGKTATPFEQRHQHQELANCRAYYYRLTRTNPTSGHFGCAGISASGSTFGRAAWFLPVSPWRQIATTDISSSGLVAYDGNGPFNVTSINGIFHEANQNIVSINGGIFSGLAAGNPCMVLLASVGTSYIAYDIDFY